MVAGRTSRSFRYTLSLPHEVDGHQQWIRYCRSRSNIIVRLIEEAKSQAQPERGSCERSRGSLCVGGHGAVPWSTHIARLLHETKLLFEPTIVVLVLASIAL